jgi:hypothetical protein
MTFYAVVHAEVTIAVVEAVNMSSALEKAMCFVKPRYRLEATPDERAHNIKLGNGSTIQIGIATPKERTNAPWVRWTQFEWFAK